MPTETIVPDATSAPHPTWTETSGGSSNVNLALDADDNNFARCVLVEQSFVVTFGNLTSNVNSISSIRFFVNGFDSGVRGASDVVSFDLLNSSNSSYGLSENFTFTDSSLSDVQLGTPRSGYLVGGKTFQWTENTVNGLRMKVKWVSRNDNECVLDLDHLGIIVDYIETISPVSLKLSQGFIKLTSGKITV